MWNRGCMRQVSGFIVVGVGLGLFCPAAAVAADRPAGKAPSGTLVVQADPKDVSLFLGVGFLDSAGAAKGMALAPGTYSVLATADGYASRTESVTIAAGKTTRARLKLERLAPGAVAGGAASREFQGAPRWVLEGCDSVKSTGDVACGAGTSNSSPNPASVRFEAYMRGVAGLAKALNVKLTGLLKDAQASASQGESFGTAADEEHVSGVLNSMVETRVLPELSDDWTSPSGAAWAYVTEGAAAFADAINRSGVDPKLKAYIVPRVHPGGAARPNPTIVAIGAADLLSCGPGEGETVASASLAALGLGLVQASGLQHGFVVKALYKSYSTTEADGQPGESHMADVARILGDGTFDGGGRSVRVGLVGKMFSESNSVRDPKGVLRAESTQHLEVTLSVDFGAAAPLKIYSNFVVADPGTRSGAWLVKVPEGSTAAATLDQLVAVLPAVGIELVDLARQTPVNGAPVVRARLRVLPRP